MRTYAYPYEIEAAGPDEFLVRFPDVPEALTSGRTRQAAADAAPDALAGAIEYYLERGRPVPAPTPVADDAPRAALAPALAARLALAEAMAAQGLSQVAVAARWGRDVKSVQRALSGRNASLDLTLSALGALGVRPALTV